MGDMFAHSLDLIKKARYTLGKFWEAFFIHVGANHVGEVHFREVLDGMCSHVLK